MPDVPLWAAIFWSLMIGLANVLTIGFILYDRFVINHSQEESQLYRASTGLTPGMFRKLMAIGSMKQTDLITELTCVGKPLTNLHFVVELN